MRRCDNTITFSPTIRILKATVFGPFQGRFVSEDKFITTPHNGFLVKVNETKKKTKRSKYTSF